MTLLNYVNALLEKITRYINDYIKEKSPEKIAAKYEGQTGFLVNLKRRVELLYLKVIVEAEKKV